MIDLPRELDDAIDRVAATLVAAPHDDGLFSRVIEQLPERKASPRFMAMRVQLAVAAALVLVALLYARPSREAAPAEPRRVATIDPVDAPIPFDSQSQSQVRPLAQGRPDPLRPAIAISVASARSEQARSLIPDPRSPIPDPRSPIPDHERSLAPVEPLAALDLTSIDPAALEPEAAAVPVPLVLTELPLASDTFSPREP